MAARPCPDAAAAARRTPGDDTHSAFAAVDCRDRRGHEHRLGAYDDQQHQGPDQGEGKHPKPKRQQSEIEKAKKLFAQFKEQRRRSRKRQI